MNTQRQSFLPRLVLAASMFGAIAVAVPGSVAAQSRLETAISDGVVSVSYSDLDLSTARGAKTLAARITNAAIQVCEDTNDVLPHNLGEGNTVCRRAAVARAVAGLHAPLVNEALGISPSPIGLARR
jgi:UrcA family protein